MILLFGSCYLSGYIACGLNSTLCDPGYEFTNDTDCSCVLSNICLTQPPPCENGGSCILNSAPDSFTCNCATGFMGTNCSGIIMLIIEYRNIVGRHQAYYYNSSVLVLVLC